MPIFQSSLNEAAMLQAKDIMTREVITVTEDTAVSEIAKFLLEKRINGLPVLNDQGEVVGVVSNSDLIDQTKKLHIPTVIALFDAVIYLERVKKFRTDLEKMAGSTAKDICSKNPITITPETSVEDLATIMAEKHVHTLPVMQGEKLVGIVGKMDIIRTMVP
jgi:CBS domain-containing protein